MADRFILFYSWKATLFEVKILDSRDDDVGEELHVRGRASLGCFLCAWPCMTLYPICFD